MSYLITVYNIYEDIPYELKVEKQRVACRNEDIQKLEVNKNEGSEFHRSPC